LLFGLAMVAVLTVVSGARAAVLTPPAAMHWCRAGDPPLHASRQTSCDLAGNLINRLFNGPALTQGSTRTIAVAAAASGTAYRLRLVYRGDHVVATGPDGIWISFYYEG